MMCINAVHSAQVFRTNWWMHHYLSITPKRHYGYSNSPCVRGLDKGKLVGWKHRDKQLKVATAVQYKDSKGKLRYKGTKHLKKTETLDSNNQNDPNKRYIYAVYNPSRRIFLYIHIVSGWVTNLLHRGKKKTKKNNGCFHGKKLGTP